jgi:hypothetical protein
LWTVTIRSFPEQPPSVPPSPEDVPELLELVELLELEPPELVDADPELVEAVPELLLLVDPAPSVPESGEPDGLLLLLQALMTHANESEPMLVAKRNRE